MADKVRDIIDKFVHIKTGSDNEPVSTEELIKQASSVCDRLDKAFEKIAFSEEADNGLTTEESSILKVLNS